MTFDPDHEYRAVFTYSKGGTAATEPTHDPDDARERCERIFNGNPAIIEATLQKRPTPEPWDEISTASRPPSRRRCGVSERTGVSRSGSVAEGLDADSPAGNAESAARDHAVAARDATAQARSDERIDALRDERPNG